ncbi:AraC family transcriptional regulator [Paenibacillus polygoni]|uniref:AraC family transcriptional regulator n=1 Tax=Paenibacillus polygoni TaxID=3050112 RepID=A0ABY8X386_9BACL|nr:AraC family transcriptional regulator [Paenibacillus polygoni]WIV19995.1 AraC family transcriptional regulator [Paenibacillus polygoni]
MPDMNAGITRTYKVELDDRLLYTGHVSNNPGWQFPSHKHEDLFEILVIKEGEGKFTIGDIEYDAAEGDILIYNKGILHAEKSSKDKPIYICYCGFHSHKEWIIPPDRDPVIRANSYSAEIITLMELLFEESTIRGEGHEQICQHLLQSILLLVSRMLSKQTQSPDTGRQQIVLDIKEYIDMNYTQPLTLKKMADHFNISPYYFAHLFKNRYSTSPIHYMIQRRMGEATRLLVQTEMRVWEIAKLTGYENANYFSILFTKVVGMSPRQYRDNHKKTLSYPSRE